VGSTLAVVLIAAIVILAVVGQIFLRRTFKAGHPLLQEGIAEAMLGVVGTLFSLLLGLLVANAIETYHETYLQVEGEANGCANVFRLARGLEEEDRLRIRGLCREYVNLVISEEWAAMEKAQMSESAFNCYVKIWEACVAIEPKYDRQNNIHQVLLESMAQFAEDRRMRIIASQNQLSPVLWIVIVCGSAITILFSYMFTAKLDHMHNTILTVLIALSLGLNIWLLAAYSSPFKGELQISPSMFILLRDRMFKITDGPSPFINGAQRHDAPSPPVAGPSSVQ
jgi:RsiW-degrading membrane proteinase PrsW (M82 family)